MSNNCWMVVRAEAKVPLGKGEGALEERSGRTQYRKKECTDNSVHSLKNLAIGVEPRREVLDPLGGPPFAPQDFGSAQRDALSGGEDAIGSLRWFRTDLLQNALSLAGDETWFNVAAHPSSRMLVIQSRSWRLPHLWYP